MSPAAASKPLISPRVAPPARRAGTAPAGPPTGDPAAAVNEFFSYWFEWVRSPNRRTPAMQHSGLPGSATSILHRVRHAGPIHISALARSFGLDKSTISRQMEPLRVEGLIDERPSDTNRRVAEITLSAKGERLHRRLAQAQTEYWERVLARLPPGDRRELARLLGLLRAAIDEIDEHERDAAASAHPAAPEASRAGARRTSR